MNAAIAGYLILYYFATNKFSSMQVGKAGKQPCTSSIARSAKSLARLRELQLDKQRKLKREKREGWHRDLSGGSVACSYAPVAAEEDPALLSSSEATMPSRAEILGGSVLRGRASPPRKADLPHSRSIDTINRIMNSSVP